MMKKYIYLIAISLLFISVSSSVSAASAEINRTQLTSLNIATNNNFKIFTPKKKYKNKHVRKSRARKFGGWN